MIMCSLRKTNYGEFQHLNTSIIGMSNQNQHSAYQANKFDTSKPRMELIPAIPQIEYAKVLTFGAKKYGDDNWRLGTGLIWSRIIGAMERHLYAIKNGEDY